MLVSRATTTATFVLRSSHATGHVAFCLEDFADAHAFHDIDCSARRNSSGPWRRNGMVARTSLDVLWPYGACRRRCQLRMADIILRIAVSSFTHPSSSPCIGHRSNRRAIQPGISSWHDCRYGTTGSDFSSSTEKVLAAKRLRIPTDQSLSHYFGSRNNNALTLCHESAVTAHKDSAVPAMPHQQCCLGPPACICGMGSEFIGP